eukprot:1193069-Prorocentrum_minimum.AAC.1
MRLHILQQRLVSQAQQPLSVYGNARGSVTRTSWFAQRSCICTPPSRWSGRAATEPADPPDVAWSVVIQPQCYWSPRSGGSTRSGFGRCGWIKSSINSPIARRDGATELRAYQAPESTVKKACATDIEQSTFVNSRRHNTIRRTVF